MKMLGVDIPDHIRIDARIYVINAQLAETVGYFRHYSLQMYLL